jgi:hypothetical protein
MSWAWCLRREGHAAAGAREADTAQSTDWCRVRTCGTPAGWGRRRSARFTHRSSTAPGRSSGSSSGGGRRCRERACTLSSLSLTYVWKIQRKVLPFDAYSELWLLDTPVVCICRRSRPSVICLPTWQRPPRVSTSAWCRVQAVGPGLSWWSVKRLIWSDCSR